MLQFKVISDITEAEKAWKTLSPKQFVYDEWELRYGYYQFFNYPLFFYAGYDGNELVGLLPLMWDEQKGYLDFFAGFSYMEDNTLFLKPGYEQHAALFIQQIDRPALLESMRESMSGIAGATIHDYNYYIELVGMKTYADFLHAYLNGESRRNITSQVRKIQQHEVKIAYDEPDDIAVMAAWNKARFGETSSFFTRPHWEEYFVFMKKNFASQTVSVTIDGKKQGVGLVVFYNDICYGTNAGFNPEVKNLGKYITLLKIQIALDKGMRIYDAGGSGAFGWKEDFNLKKRPLYHIDLRK